MSAFIFDIDGTLADASHRLHYIVQPAEQMRDHVVPDFKKDWDAFLSDEEVAKDVPIPAMWDVLTGLVREHHYTIFVTGRPERLRQVTYDWLTNVRCEYRCMAAWYWRNSRRKPILMMRSDTDRRPSAEVKRDRLRLIRLNGFKPLIAFDDRAADIAMYRENGLIGCQVNEGAF